MISVQEAISIVLKNTPQGTVEEVDLTEALGFNLAENVVTDVNMPPFDKSSMDGYAFKSEDCPDDGTALHIVGTIPAGKYPDFKVASGEAAKIMTGAPIPEGADCVQKVEETEALSDSKVRILTRVPVGKNVAFMSEIMTAGNIVLPKNTYISPAVIGVLATVGRKRVKIHKRLRVGILVTGDELVEVEQKPGPGQLRNSNGYTLFSQVMEAGGIPHMLGIATDDFTDLKTKISQGLQHDILLISGGVSMGDFDFVEDVLHDLGVEKYFDKVNIKPGKPSVFGKTERSLVFGLPGNPVSASTVFEIIVRPCLRKLLGFQVLHNLRMTAVLETEHPVKTSREYYHPSKCYFTENKLFVKPVNTKGSADVLSFAKSNCYIVTPAGANDFQPGQSVEVIIRSDYWKSLM